MISQPSTDTTDFQIFKTILTHCISILILPVITFFVTKFIIFDFLQTSALTSSVSSAIAAVTALHIALGAYIYRAYSMATPPKVPAKIE